MKTHDGKSTYRTKTENKANKEANKLTTSASVLFLHSLEPEETFLFPPLVCERSLPLRKTHRATAGREVHVSIGADESGFM